MIIRLSSVYLIPLSNPQVLPQFLTIPANASSEVIFPSTQVFTTSAPLPTAIIALPLASPFLLSQLTPMAMPSPTLFLISATKSAKLSGILSAASSHKVTVVAPACFAAEIASIKNSFSALVASIAQNSTSLIFSFAAVTSSLISSNIFGAFLWQVYSIPTGDIGSSIRSLGLAVALSAAAALLTPSTVIPVATDKMLSLTKEDTVFIKSISVLAFSITGSSIISTFNFSSCLAISSFSLKLKDAFSLLKVLSAIIIFFIFPTILFKNKVEL